MDNRLDNSYLKKLLQKSNKSPKTGGINLTSYNENFPSFRVSIRDILSTEENKQKAINYVVQKRNEEKYGKKTGYNNKEDNNNKNLYVYKTNKQIYNSNSKLLNKNNQNKNNIGLNSNRTNYNINQNINNSSRYFNLHK